MLMSAPGDQAMRSNIHSWLPPQLSFYSVLLDIARGGEGDPPKHQLTIPSASGWYLGLNPGSHTGTLYMEPLPSSCLLFKTVVSKLS